MAIRELFTKQPFYRLENGGLDLTSKRSIDVSLMKYAERQVQGRRMTQADYVEEYYPTSHRIMSEAFFPESYGYGQVITETGEKLDTMYREETFRIGSTLQSLITMQQLVHLTGNDIHFELTDAKVRSGLESDFLEFQKGWLTHNMELAFCGLARSVKITADGAAVFYLQNGKVKAKSLSFLNGDFIYPHYDPITGEMDKFVRRFSSYDDEGKEIISWVEVWDDTYLSRYKETRIGFIGAWNRAKETFGFDGYELVSRGKHGFSRCPIVYMRDSENGPCWNKVQGLIEDYEVSLSYFAKNNAATALPAYVMKGEDVEVKGDPLGRVRAFTMGKEDDVSLIKPNGLSENYTKYIEYLLNEIFQGGFIVKHPELKSGDTPTGTMKLYYAPSLDKATMDAKEYKPAVDKMKSLFCEGYGIERKAITKFMELGDDIFGWIIPYVHENVSSLISDLIQSKNSGILSVRSATEHHPYASNNEFDRITQEQKKEQQADRLFQLRSLQNATRSEESEE